MEKEVKRQQRRRRMRQAIEWLAGSMMVGKGGSSARKLTAFACVLFAAYCHLYATAATALHFLIVDLACALLCLGTITMEQLIQVRTGSSNRGQHNKPQTDTQ